MQRFSRLGLAAAVLAFMNVPGVALAQSTPDAAPAATAPSTAQSATGATEKAAPKNKKPARKMTRRQEIDHSIDTGTVPARYRSSVPKEYQQYIPFEKR